MHGGGEGEARGEQGFGGEVLQDCRVGRRCIRCVVGHAQSLFEPGHIREIG